MQAVNLTEWETREPIHGGPLAGVVLAGNPTAQQMAERLTSEGRIEILELARGLELRASSFVGRFTLGDLMVTIRPKISGIPLMNLLRYAYRLRHLDLFAQVDYATSASSFEDLLIHQLAAEASELFTRGLQRDYFRTESMLSSPRGRIAFDNYLQVACRAGVTLPCVHHPRSEDTNINRTLHGGLELAAGMTQDHELAGRVRQLAKRISANITATKLDVAGFDEAWHSLDRRTSAYRPAFTLIQLLLNTQGAALTNPTSSIPAAGFLFDMNRFFQALLLRFLGENLVDYQVEDETKLRGVFAYDQANNPHHRQSPALRPDFLVLQNQRIVAVLDAKYRDLWENSLPREMLYQLALYAMGQQSHERRATIIYPTLDEAARQQVILVNDPLHGTTKAQVILRPVNLMKLDALLRTNDAYAQRNRSDFAYRLAFGTCPDVLKN